LMAGMRRLALPIWKRFVDEVPQSRSILEQFLNVTGKMVAL